MAIATLAIVILIAGVNRPKHLLFLYAASLPFFGVVAEVGIQVTPYHVISAIMGVILLLSPSSMQLPRLLVPFLIYAVSITFFMSFILPDSVYQFSALRGKFRWISQIVVITLIFLPAIFAINVKADERDIPRMINIFLGVSAFLCLTGILQIIIFRVTGNDIFPINLFTGFGGSDDLRSGLSRISPSEKILRMSGMGGGEPKHFGYTAAVAFILNMLVWIIRPGVHRDNTAGHVLLAALFGSSILLSLSTQAYLILALNLFLITLGMVFKKGLLNKRSLLVIAFLGLGIIALVKSNYARRLLELRIYERLTETGAVEDFNQTIIRFLEATPIFIPFGTGLGNIHFWAAEYIPKEFGYFMRGNVFVAKAGFLRLISEVGVVGFVLFLFCYLGYGLLAFRRLRLFNSGWGGVSLSFMFLVLCSYMVTSDASPYYIFSLVIVLYWLRTNKSDSLRLLV